MRSLSIFTMLNAMVGVTNNVSLTRDIFSIPKLPSHGFSGYHIGNDWLSRGVKTAEPDNTDYDKNRHWDIPMELKQDFAPYQLQWMQRKRSKQELTKGYHLHSSQTSRKALARQHKKPKKALAKKAFKGIVIAR